MPAHPLPRRTTAPVTFRRREVPGNPRLDRMTRYRGGTFSHTVATVAFVDGSVARTDLIRLNPNVEAYSLDFTAAAPTRPSHYRAATWAALPNPRARTHEPEVDWILRSSVPTIGTAELSRRLRAAGYPLGPANVAEHEAIAATQAAIWFFTNDMELDDRPRNVPVAQRRESGCFTFEFDGEPQLGGFTVDVTSPGAATLRLQKSADGQHWDDVTTSALSVTGPGRHRRVLGTGSTVSAHRPGRPGVGYRHYRLVADGAVEFGPVEFGPVEFGDVEFWLDGSGHYRNPDRVVHLYRYLVAGARRSLKHTFAPELSAVDATVYDGIVGPFRMHASQAAAVSVSAGSVIDADGVQLTACQPGGEFYLRTEPGAASVTLTATVPARHDGFGGRVITGVARDEVNSRLTPVALAVPAPLVVEFHVGLPQRTPHRTVVRQRVVEV